MFFIQVDDCITRVRENNIFTLCVECGERIYVDLSSFLKNEDTNLQDELVCKDCYNIYYK